MTTSLATYTKAGLESAYARCGDLEQRVARGEQSVAAQPRNVLLGRRLKQRRGELGEAEREFEVYLRRYETACAARGVTDVEEWE